MKTQKMYLYEGRKDVTLTSYLIDDSPELLNGKPRPAMLVCPGGGYLNCSDREGEPVALRFASMGYHAFVLRYSTHSGNKPAYFPETADIPVNENCVHPAPMRDIGMAFTILHDRAEEWGLDTARIALCGFSAGAHNCAMYATHWHRPVIAEFFKREPSLFRPAAAILAYGLSDYHLMRGEMQDDFAKLLSKASSIALMGTDKPSKELIDELSPSFHVTKNAPPMFIWATFEDTLVPVEQSTRMATACAAAGVPFEIHVFENGPHGLSLADQSTAASRMEVQEDAAKWVELARVWLQKRMALPLNEKPFWMMQLE